MCEKSGSRGRSGRRGWRGRHRGWRSRLLCLRRCSEEWDHGQKTHDEPGRQTLVVIVETLLKSEGQYNGVRGRGVRRLHSFAPYPSPLSSVPSPRRRRPPRRDRRRRRRPSAARKSRIFGSNDSIPCRTSSSVTHVSGLSDSAWDRSASTRSAFSAALGDPSKQFRVARAQPCELLVSDVLDRYEVADRFSLRLPGGLVVRTLQRPRVPVPVPVLVPVPVPSGSGSHSSRVPARTGSVRFRGLAAEAVVLHQQAGFDRGVRGDSSLRRPASLKPCPRRASRRAAEPREFSASRTRCPGCVPRSRGWRPDRARDGQP